MSIIIWSRKQIEFYLSGDAASCVRVTCLLMMVFLLYRHGVQKKVKSKPRAKMPEKRKYTDCFAY